MLVRNISHSKKNAARNHQNVRRSSCKAAVTGQILMKFEFS